MSALVRRATPEDAEAIARVHIRSWQSAYRGQLPDHYLDGLDQVLDQRIEFWRTGISAPPTKSTEIWVAETEAQVAGFVAIGPARDADPTTGELYAIYVNPNRWGQGVGRTIFGHATGRLAALEYSTAILWVLESNGRARRFYEVAGWTADGGTKQEYVGGIELREVSYGVRFHREKEEE